MSDSNVTEHYPIAVKENEEFVRFYAAERRLSLNQRKEVADALWKVDRSRMLGLVAGSLIFGLIVNVGTRNANPQRRSINTLIGSFMGLMIGGDVAEAIGLAKLSARYTDTPNMNVTMNYVRLHGGVIWTPYFVATSQNPKLLNIIDEKLKSNPEMNKLIGQEMVRIREEKIASGEASSMADFEVNSNDTAIDSAAQNWKPTPANTTKSSNAPAQSETSAWDVIRQDQGASNSAWDSIRNGKASSKQRKPQSEYDDTFDYDDTEKAQKLFDQQLELERSGSELPDDFSESEKKYF
ncbi:hypothetical protein CANCADRAFT_42313 [Tortispora caseinolytica NRRL Y-17796]|uniref:Uncharacterized protein n=1 Tax=Tortispora caseinolytica NRRL Y-17796 TaxID=767744 RepID=A0A1E4TIV2_9ASCO|nr:hypothetical protein CANCADRAFT_42313 [Tortispora caseinolytica NRRL Y-17796]